MHEVDGMHKKYGIEYFPNSLKLTLSSKHRHVEMNARRSN